MFMRCLALASLAVFSALGCSHKDGDPCEWGETACCLDDKHILNCEGSIGSTGTWRISECDGLLTGHCVAGNDWENAECQ